MTAPPPSGDKRKASKDETYEYDFEQLDLPVQKRPKQVTDDFQAPPKTEDSSQDKVIMRVVACLMHSFEQPLTNMLVLYLCHTA